MLIDHFGLMFYPNIVVFRAIGRLAMPIFAYCIGGGVLKTRNKLKYFLWIKRSVHKRLLLCDHLFFQWSLTKKVVVLIVSSHHTKLTI